MAKDKLSRFGATVLSLCAERGIKTRQELVTRIKDAGYTRISKKGEVVPLFSHSLVGHYLYGTNAVNRTFCKAVLEVLRLSDTERIRLAEAYTFGQDEEAADRLEVA